MFRDFLRLSAGGPHQRSKAAGKTKSAPPKAATLEEEEEDQVVKSDDEKLPGGYPLLPKCALDIYEQLLPTSIFMKSPEAVKVLLSRPDPVPKVSMPCRSKGCLLDPTRCIPYKGNSDKCAPCQKAQDPCTWQYPGTGSILGDQLRGHWDLAHGPSNAAYLNSLYNQLAEHWESYRLLQGMANREATKFRVEQRFIASYVATLNWDGNPFLDRLIDRDTVADLINKFPVSVYEKRAVVPPLREYLLLPNPFQAGISIPAPACEASSSPEPKAVPEAGPAPKDVFDMSFEEDVPAETAEPGAPAEGEHIFEAEAGPSSSS
ncbi:hypothetical protein MD484_g8850, partial [Candolleomyces efflorescens]